MSEQDMYSFGVSTKDDIVLDKTPNLDAADETSMLNMLRKTLAKKVARTDVLLEVPERPEIVVRYSPNITNQQMKAWRRASGSDRKDGIDSVRFACHVLANTCVGIMLNGVDITENGDPVTFNHESVMKMVGASRVFDTVLAVYGVDPHVEAAALAVLDAAGFNDSVEQVDPTKNS